jgi:pimeloyl-ACP methyl ester carboxylesterase
MVATSRHIFVLSIAAAAVVPGAPRTAVAAVESKPHTCQIEGIQGETFCATYPVWEDRDRKSGRKIGLNIVVLPAPKRDRSPDPMFFLHGGPGAAASELASGFSRGRGLFAGRDLVFIDQRGTGGSNPLDCDFYGEPPNLQRVVSVMFPLDSIRACRERLAKIVDLRLYTTALGMDDVDEVRQWLGYEKINIWSGSYGTMAAQVYLHRHSSSVRSAILLGVDPVDEPVPLHHASAGQRAVDIILDKCRADSECNAAYPNVREEFVLLFERVRKGVDVDVHDSQGRTVRVRPSVLALAEGVRHYLYYDDGRSLPQMIHQTAKGDLAPLIERAIAAQIDLRNRLSMAMNLSVTCAETVPFIDDASLARETAKTFLGDLRVQEQRAACREWPRGSIPVDLRQLVRSDVPVLLMSGNRDSVTPPSFAERVWQYLSNSRHVVFPDASHGNFGACGNRIMAQFVARGSVKDIDVSCAAQHAPIKFVIEP